MNVAIGDLRKVVLAARALGGHVVLSGHSLGGTVVTAYATWDFHGKPGAADLDGLVYDDGASGPTTLTADQARTNLTNFAKATPWLAFSGVPAPFLGLFSALGATGSDLQPRQPVARPAVAAAAGVAEAVGPGHRAGPVRLRGRHQDVDADVSRPRPTSASST